MVRMLRNTKTISFPKFVSFYYFSVSEELKFGTLIFLIICLLIFWHVKVDILMIILPAKVLNIERFFSIWLK